MPAACPTRRIIARKAGASAPWCASSTNEAGQPVQSFVKDLIRVGEYVKASTNQDLSVTSEDIDHWVGMFRAMKAAGVKVPVPLDHSGLAEHNRGWVTDLYRVNDTLYGVLELVGSDAIEMAGRTEVSIGVLSELIDGKGTKYLNVIEHVALTAYPVVPDQGGFIKLSRDGKKESVPVYLCDCDKPKEPTMSLIQELATLLGCDPDDMKEEKKMGDAVKARVAAMLSEAKTATATNASLKAENDTLKAGKKVEAPSPQVLRIVGENRQLKIDAARAKGVGKDFCDAVEAIVIGGKDRVALSRTADEQSDGLIAAFLDAVGKLTPVRPAGNATGTPLTRQAPNDTAPDADSKAPTKEEKEANLARARELRGIRPASTK